MYPGTISGTKWWIQSTRDLAKQEETALKAT